MERHWACAWITGGSSGLGLALARQLEDRADHVAVTSRTFSVRKSKDGRPESIRSFPADVTDEAGLAACIETVERECGPIDLAVLNAGTWTLMDADRFSLDAVRKGIEVNYMGVIHALNGLIPNMIERGRGHIVIVASVAGYRGLPRAAAYGPTKAALINLAETLKPELGRFGIQVSLVNPGFVDTPMTQNNPFPMPDLMPAERAAQIMLAGLEKGRFEITFPRRFVLAMKLLRLLPYTLFFMLARRMTGTEQIDR